MNHDRRIPLPMFDVYGVGCEASMPATKLVAALGLKEGVVSSGNSLDYTDKWVWRFHVGALVCCSKKCTYCTLWI